MSKGERGERKRERAGHDGKGKERREAFFRFPSSPGRFLFFHLYCYFFEIPSGSLCGGETVFAFPKNQHFQIPIQFLVLDIGRNS